jgi:hypothetical protein
MIEVTGYCWYCGKACSGLYCDKRHEELYKKRQTRDRDHYTFNGKREGYGLRGSTH